MQRPYAQVDVFTAVPYRGNPLAVVVDGEGIADGDLARFANWTNLSETTFLLPPTVPGADYRVRIFTPGGELPFAGHPTLGSCRVWLDHGGDPADEHLVQECGGRLGPYPSRRRSTGVRCSPTAPVGTGRRRAGARDRTHHRR